MIMRVCKDKENPYVMLNKIWINNETLSLKAKGMLTYILSLPDDWQIYEEELVKHSKDGLKSHRTAIKELIKAGHIIREQKRSDDGKFGGYEYCVYEIPPVMPKTENGKTENRKSNATNKELKLNNNKKEYPSFQNQIKPDNRTNFNQRDYANGSLDSLYSNSKSFD